MVSIYKVVISVCLYNKNYDASRLIGELGRTMGMFLDWLKSSKPKFNFNESLIMMIKCYILKSIQYLKEIFIRKPCWRDSLNAAEK